MIPVRWFGLVTLTETDNQLWSIPVKIMYHAIIPFICLTFKLALRNSTTKTVFFSVLNMGCNFNLTQVTGREYGRASFVWILTGFKLMFFVFLLGSLVGFLWHCIHASQVLENSVNQQHFGKNSFSTYLNHLVVIYPITLTEAGEYLHRGWGSLKRLFHCLLCLLG